MQTNDSKWSLWSDVEEYGYTTRRVIVTIEYVGRECRMPQTEFGDPDEAKAWVNAIVRLEGA